MKSRLFCLFLCGLLLMVATAAIAQKQETPGYGLLAADVFDLNLDVDTTVDIAGETRFFSSRHNWYAGGRIMIHMEKQGTRPGDSFYFGWFTGWMWGKSKFLMNWEEPGLMSFDPFDGYFTTFAWPVGFDANLKMGGILTISPFVSAKMMTINMKVELGDEDYGDTALKLGFAGGAKASIHLGSFTIAGGAGWNKILGEEIDFEMDDSLTFNSKTGGSSVEYFLGVEL